MLETIENNFNEVQKSDKLGAMSTFYNDAYTMIASPKAQEAFDVRKEPIKLQEEYGQNQQYAYAFIKTISRSRFVW